ncbi:MAG TPA: HDOD domain-containing protein [Verrucomicrobiae bacterium]|nr:HDOD domain-containing protein [Verrucomicrobiae bacterium]
MAWFDRKPKKGRMSLSRLEEIEPAAGAASQILEGDENATTPVEGESLGKLGRLYAFSPVAIALIRLFDREDADTKEIANLVGSDATLAAETLAFVNSPLFAITEPIASLKHAITVLGFENVRSLAATLAMRSMLASAPKPGVLRRIWQHSIATSVVAGELAPIYGVDAGLASTAGVLHDLGRMGLLAQYSESYAKIIFSVFEDTASILEEERRICALDHCDAGFLLGKAWKLPKVFQEVAEKHHKAAGLAGVVGLVHTACILADTLGYSGVAIRHVPTTAVWLKSAPDHLRYQIQSHWAETNQRVVQRIELLDF